MHASQRIKRECNVPVVWGGIHPTMLPEQTLMNDFIDIIVIGEGEETLVELVRTLHDGGTAPDGLNRIAGLGFRVNGATVITHQRPFIKISMICIPPGTFWI